MSRHPLPASWRVVRLDEVATVQTGRAIGRARLDGPLIAVPYLTVANVKDGYVDLSALKTMDVTWTSHRLS